MTHVSALIDDAIFVFELFFFSSTRRHTRCGRDWSSDVCSSGLGAGWFESSANTQAATCSVLGALAQPTNKAVAIKAIGIANFIIISLMVWMPFSGAY